MWLVLELLHTVKISARSAEISKRLNFFGKI